MQTALPADHLVDALSANFFYRSADLTPGAGRPVYGVAIPYGQVAEVSDGDGFSYLERFEFGACSRTIRERGSKVKLLALHDHRRFPIGKATSLTERSDGLHGEFAIPETREGDDVLTLIRDGVLDSFSIGFRGIRERTEGGVRVRTEVALIEVSLVGLPAYEGALVGRVRSQLVIPKAVAERRLRLLELESIESKGDSHDGFRRFETRGRRVSRRGSRDPRARW